MQVLRTRIKIHFDDGTWFSGQVDSRDSIIIKATPKLLRWQGRRLSDLLAWVEMKKGITQKASWKSEFVEQES